MAPRGVSTWRRPYTSIYNDNYKYGTGLYSDTLTDIEKRYSQSIAKTQLRSDRPDLTFTTFSGSNLTSSPAPGVDSSTRENYGYSRQLSVSPTPEYTRSPNFENRLNATLQSAAAACDLGEDVESAIRSRIEARKNVMVRSVSEVQSKTEADEDEEFRIRLERRRQAIKNLTESRANTADDEEYSIKPRKITTEEYTIKPRKTTTEEYIIKPRKTTNEEPLKPTSLYDDYSLWTLPKSSDKLTGLDLDNPKSSRKAGGRSTPTNGSGSKLRDRSQALQDQVESLDKSMSNAGNKLRSELSSLKSKYHTEFSDLSGSVENTTQQASDLQRLCKRQASQLQELQSAYDSAQRNVQEALEGMSNWQNKCKSLKKEMDRLREEVEMAVNKRSKA